MVEQNSRTHTTHGATILPSLTERLLWTIFYVNIHEGTHIEAHLPQPPFDSLFIASHATRLATTD